MTEPVTVAVVNAKTGPAPLAMQSYVQGGWAGLQSAMWLLRSLFINTLCVWVGAPTQLCVDEAHTRNTHSCVYTGDTAVCVHVYFSP